MYETTKTDTRGQINMQILLCVLYTNIRTVTSWESESIRAVGLYRTNRGAWSVAYDRAIW